MLNALEAMESKLFWNVTVLALGISNKTLFDEAVHLVTRMGLDILKLVSVLLTIDLTIN